jgi:adenylyltransferase/sulfurtransferase
VRYRLHPEHLTPTTALGVFKQYDLVLDCTDHPTSRYLISDAAVLAGIRLVSASALRTEGQLLVLNDPPKLGNNHGGPCYRCIFPKPPSPESVTSCGEGGILGPVVGVMGVLMAVEALKLLARKTTMGSEPHAPQGLQAKVPSHSMLIYSAFSTTPFRTLKLRGKRADCASCSQQPSITEDSLTSGSLDYAVFCGVLSPVSILKPEERTTAEDFAGVKDNAKEHFVLVDVRDETQFGLCNIPESVNIPFLDIERLPDDYEDERTVTTLSPLLDKLHSLPPDAKIYTVCRLGNDSQATARKLKELGLDNNGQRWIGDIKGGFYAWRETVDPSWPRY